LGADAKDLAKQIFRRLGEAEAKVHGTTLEKVHFHEVGAIDSIADIVGAAIALRELEIQGLTCSTISTGFGEIEIAHGRVGVPAPATAELLQGFPVRTGIVESELTTPTGAAILATLAKPRDPSMPLDVQRIGIGAGMKDFLTQANVLRLSIGITGRAMSPSALGTPEVLEENLVLLECNVDDTSGEILGRSVELFLHEGALDATASPLIMKKGRPGWQLQMLCREHDAARLIDLLIREVPTLGLKRWPVSRLSVPRRHETVTTPWGVVRVVVSPRGGTDTLVAPEFEDCRSLATQTGVPLIQVYQAAQRAAAQVRWVRDSH
jgi:hypothetical protein